MVGCAFCRRDSSKEDVEAVRVVPVIHALMDIHVYPHISCIGCTDGHNR